MTIILWFSYSSVIFLLFDLFLIMVLSGLSIQLLFFKAFVYHIA